jgi:hypothetical protein
MKGTRWSNLHRSFGNERPGSGGGTQWWTVRLKRRRQGWLVGIEPRACSSGSLTTWSSPTQSTQDGGCHQRLRGCRQGRAQAGDEQGETKRHGEVGGMGSLWCSLSFGSSIWVILDRLTKSAHFIPVNTNYNVQKYTEIYVARVLCLHGVPKMIISDRGSQIVAHFWEQLHASLGTHLIHSSAYHPPTDVKLSESTKF